MARQHNGAGGPLLERDRVLTALSEHLNLAARGHGRVVLLPGEAGVGKTAVLDRFVDMAGSRAEVLRGWCDPLSTPRPLGAWMDIAPGLGARVQDEFDRIDGAVGGVAGLFRVVREALTPSGTRLLLFEDVHWADEASLDLIRLLARRIDELRVLLLASYRDDEIRPSHPIRVLLGDLAGVSGVHRCPLEPLSPRGVARLAAGRGLDVDELYRVTGGNAFFVTEVLATGGDGIPATVGDTVAGRLSRLSPGARRAAEVAAVLGSPAPVQLVFDLAEGAAERTEELLGAGVLYPSGDGLAFRHELARMAVLDRIPAFDRAALHARVLNRLRADPARRGDSALLAHHAEAAGDGDAVLVYALIAAARATGSGAHREAASQYRRALRFGAPLPPVRRATLLEELAQSSFLAGQVLDGISAMRDALELRRELSDPLREGEDLRWLSFALWPVGRGSEAWRTGEQAVRVLEALAPSRELAWAYVNMCQLAAYDQRGVAVAEAYAHRALSLSAFFEDPEAGGQARFHLALTRFISAHDDSSTDDNWADMQLAQVDMADAGLLEACAFLAMLSSVYASVHRDHDRAASALETLERIAGDRDLLLYRRIGSAHRPLGLLHRDLWDEAAELAAAVVDQPGLTPAARVIPLLALGTIRARRGDPGSREVLDEALRIFEPCGWWTLLVSAARAEAAWLDGDPPRARDEAQRGLEQATRHSDPWLTGALARWVRIAGGQPPPVRAAEPFALELAGDWRGAAQAWDDRGCHYDAALARLSGDPPALLRALRTFESLGARPAAELATARLRGLGVRAAARGPRPSTRTNPHGLTDRQREIFDLVRAGMTGPRIAARLHLSPKTVDHHISAVLAKLGVHSRAEAVRVLAE